MPNEWDAFVAAGDQATAAENELWNAATGGADATGLATSENVQTRRNRRMRWKDRSTGEKLVAAGRSTINNLPIFGESLSPSGQEDVQEFRENMPISSFATNVVGSAAPLAGMANRVGAPVLNRMFGSTPRAMTSGGTLGYADAATRDQNPAVGAGIGAIAAGLGRGAGRTISPRDATHPQVQARTNAGNSPPTINDDMLPPGYSAADFGPELPAQREIRQRIAQSRVASQQRNDRQLPNFNSLPPWARMLTGGAGAYGLGAHPVAGAVAGYVAPHVIRAGRNAGNRVLQSRAYDDWLNNPRLSPEQRAMLSALSTAAGPDPNALTGQ